MHAAPQPLAPTTFEDPWPERWGRRSVSVPVLLCATALGTLLLPLLLAGGVVRDLARRDARLSTLRGLIGLWGNFALHSLTLLVLALVWLLDRVFAVDAGGRVSYAVEAAAARTLFRLLRAVYRMDLVVEGLDALLPTPALVLARHTSVLDPLFVLGLAAERGVILRFVCKRELLWDPCIDVLGHRFPVAFVRRGQREHSQDIEAVARLGEGLAPREAVLVFPEGTRFSVEKQERALAALAPHHPELAAQAARWRHVLPPHPGGVLALLHEDPDEDVVICRHTGLEGAAHVGDLFAGVLVGRTLHVRFERVPRTAVPTGDDGCVAWLYDMFEDIDGWVGERAPGAETSR